MRGHLLSSRQVLGMKTLYVTYCSGEKKPVDEGTPEQLYDSRRIDDFISVCKSKGYEWAILSAKYGLFFPYEVKKKYNVTFKSVAHECRIVENGTVLPERESRGRFNSLVEQVRKCIAEKDIERIVFYCIQPLKRRKCYLNVLHKSADSCRINHETWDEFVKHIKKMYSDRTGRTRLVMRLEDLTV